ncbi:MAG: hypothetical protein PHI93_12500, partial [Kiritimatiellae bacterium]|nr:hypothetical protein [Kiritimatiellia bacterium]
MGIKPSGTTPIIVPQDNVQSRWGAYEASLDTAGSQAGEVFAETHAIAQSAKSEVELLLEDSRALGDESKTIQQQMRELIDPENPDSKLYYALAEVDRLASDRLDLQEEALGILRESVDSLTEYVSRSMYIPQNQPVSDEYFDVVAHPTNGHRWRVMAKPGWVGHYVWQSAYYFATGDASPVLDGREVGFDRHWDEYAWNRNNSVLTYWVKKAQYAKDDKIGGAYTTDQGV